MITSTPIKFNDAIRKFGSRTPIGLILDTKAWKMMPRAIRERAFFSAKVTNLKFLNEAKSIIDDWLQQNTEMIGGEVTLKEAGRADFIKRMREFAIKEGMLPLPGKEGSIEDLTSERRLKLIWDVNTRMAQDYAYWLQGMDPDVLADFPAYRFLREATVKEPRPYHEANLGQIRRKDDMAFWLDMNRDFRVPWGPWGFNSQCGVEDVPRSVAEKLGLVKEDEEVKPVDLGFNEELEASIEGMDESLLKEFAKRFPDLILNKKKKKVSPKHTPKPEGEKNEPKPETKKEKTEQTEPKSEKSEPSKPKAAPSQPPTAAPAPSQTPTPEPTLPEIEQLERESVLNPTLDILLELRRRSKVLKKAPTAPPPVRIPSEGPDLGGLIGLPTLGRTAQKTVAIQREGAVFKWKRKSETWVFSAGPFPERGGIIAQVFTLRARREGIYRLKDRPHPEAEMALDLIKVFGGTLLLLEATNDGEGGETDGTRE